jgi:hypothetical protein
MPIRNRPSFPLATIFFRAEMKEPKTRGFFEENDKTAAVSFPVHFRPFLVFARGSSKTDQELPRIFSVFRLPGYRGK